MDMTKPQLIVTSLPNLDELQDVINVGFHNIVQIHHTGKHNYKHLEFSNTIRHFDMEFDDYTDKKHEGSITLQEVLKTFAIANYIENFSMDYPTYISCYGGVSRSPAIAMGIYCILGLTKQSQRIAKEFPHYNRLVIDEIIKEIWRRKDEEKED